MNKAELTKSLAVRMNVTHVQAQNFLDTFHDILGEEIIKGKNVSLLGFGVFMPWKQTERVGRNPRTGVECMIVPRLSVKFKPATGFLDTLNGKGKPRRTKKERK